MSDLLGLLEGIEKLAFKILVWIILIPKTLWRIITDPSWVPHYVQRELKQEKSPFDEHISPVFLLLIVGVIPAILTSFLPTLGVVLNSPAETEATLDRVLEFNAEATFISASASVTDEYRWYVEEILTGPTGELLEDDSGNLVYTEIYREIYNAFTDTTQIITPYGTTEQHGEESTIFYSGQSLNSSKDSFFYQFEKPGSYFVNVEVVRFTPDQLDTPLEEQFSFLAVHVPENPEEPVQIINTLAPAQDPKSNASKVQEFRALLTSETGILLALIFLMPPLLFAFATKILLGEKISENSLKENFYAQCYYFSPLSLAFWATVYALYFYTIDIFFYNYQYQLTMLLPVALASLWFICTETYALAIAGKTNAWKALLVALTCVVILGSVSTLSVLFLGLQDDLRKSIIWAYPLLFYVVLIALILIRAFDWVFGRKRVSVGDVILLISFLPSTIIFVGGNLLGMTFRTESPAPTAISSPISFIAYSDAAPRISEPSATAAIPAATSTLTASPAVVASPMTYTMQRGEFPYCIARRFDVHPAQLLAANGLADGQGVPPGTTLSVPQNHLPFPGNRSLSTHPTTYTVLAPDETLYSIACRFGDVEPSAIAYANGVSSDAALWIGQQLQIP